MANAVARVQSATTPWGDDKIERNLALTVGIYYPGALIALDASDNAVKCDDTAAIRFDGVNAETVRVQVFTGDVAGDRRIKVERPFRITFAIAAATAGDVGRPVYAVDDQTVGYTSVNAVLVGWVDKVLTATSVLIKPAYVADGVPGVAGASYSVAAADGAITRKSGTVLITKAGVAVLTIADPIATVDDGKELTITSATANAHTVSNAAGSGFNGGGAGSDIGTFGGAKGDGFTIVAYQGDWYVKVLRNVTLA